MQIGVSCIPFVHKSWLFSYVYSISPKGDRRIPLLLLRSILSDGLFVYCFLPCVDYLLKRQIDCFKNEVCSEHISSWLAISRFHASRSEILAFKHFKSNPLKFPLRPDFLPHNRIKGSMETVPGLP